MNTDKFKTNPKFSSECICVYLWLSPVLVFDVSASAQIIAPLTEMIWPEI